MEHKPIWPSVLPLARATTLVAGVMVHVDVFLYRLSPLLPSQFSLPLLRGFPPGDAFPPSLGYRDRLLGDGEGGVEGEGRDFEEGDDVVDEGPLLSPELLDPTSRASVLSSPPPEEDRDRCCFNPYGNSIVGMAVGPSAEDGAAEAAEEIEATGVSKELWLWGQGASTYASPWH